MKNPTEILTPTSETENIETLSKGVSKPELEVSTKKEEKNLEKFNIYQSVTAWLLTHHSGDLIRVNI